MRKANEAKSVGFTLIELLVVIAIIGILISLILVAAADGVRRAEERATQSLITKLETAYNDRLDALLNTTAPINQTHRLLASINSLQGSYILPVGSSTSNPDDRRAQVIAQFDYIRAELPDVFFVNGLASDGNTATAAAYPLNFSAAPYPAGTNSLSSPNGQDGGSWVLPLGNNYAGLPLVLSASGPTLTLNSPQLPTTGMMGASFSAAASVYQNLYVAAAADLAKSVPGSSVNFKGGLDGVDNNGDNLIDELISPSASQSEVIVTGSTIQAFAAKVTTRLQSHTHKTARAEVLYAILVNGLSPLGSVFSPDDFTAREVQDTDGDGMPEFVDAWGEPLQFFRWPLYYGSPGHSGNPGLNLPIGTSDSQLGSASYSKASDTRQQDPLDPNQLLVSPGWWWQTANSSLPLNVFSGKFVPPASGSTNYASPGAIAFMNYFHSLVDPNPHLGNPPTQTMWDRGGNFTRREYFTKFLILSAGPDREPGVAQFGKDYSLLVDSSQITLPSSPYMVGDPTNPGSPFPAGRTMEKNAQLLIYIENQAAVNDPVARLSGSSGSFYEIPDNAPTANGYYTTATTYLGNLANSDDITNHNISAVTTGVR